MKILFVPTFSDKPINKATETNSLLNDFERWEAVIETTGKQKGKAYMAAWIKNEPGLTVTLEKDILVVRKYGKIRKKYNPLLVYFMPDNGYVAHLGRLSISGTKISKTTSYRTRHFYSQ